ncbi:MAG: GNAT family N-acetyltransferase [Oscillospiraceae bacterium]|nr:GNAT family N-acetyltransferase [Oscillospiraceae bacterium]
MQHITLAPPAGFRQWTAMYILYRTAFPRAERKPFGYIRKAYRQGKTDIWCILRDGTFLGFAATMNSPSLVMLDYLAVSKNFRGQGVGTAAMKQLIARYADREFLLEIESPFAPGPDQAHRQSRKQFYVNCGMEPLHIMADVFGVPMELLGKNCREDLDFQRYRNFYRDFYKPWAAEHILPAEYPGE